MKIGRMGGGPRISVDNDRCELYGICEAEAPTLFVLGPDGRLSYRRALNDADLEPAAAAARCCPMQAIMLQGGHHGGR